MTVAASQPSPRWSIPALVLGCLTVVAFFVVLNPPAYRAAATRPLPAEAQGGNDAADGNVGGSFAVPVPINPSVPTVVPADYRAGSVLVLRVGPDDRYLTVGQIASGARVEVVGRNDKGDWLAISLNPGSKTYGWARSTGVSGLTATALAGLPVAPVKRLP
jgi:hypothetical protein